jgi:hypothetical protein
MTDTNPFKRVIILTLAAIIIAAAATPSSAATRAKRTVAPVAQTEPYADPALPAARMLRNRAPSWQPNACWSDEGYGRYEPCDAPGM